MIRATILVAIALAQPAAQFHQGFDARVVFTPQRVPIGGVPTLVYELALTNVLAWPSTIRSIELFDERGTIATLSGDRLKRALSSAEDDVAPGGRVTVYIEQPVDRPIRAIGHRITFASTRQAVVSFEAEPVAVDPQPTPALGPPLRGGPWAAVYDPSMERGHRRVYYGPNLPGRLAIDWFRVGEAGEGLAQGRERPEQVPGYGAAVLAVADGRVVALRDDVPDPTTLRPFVRPAPEDATGNFVALDIGGGRIAFYEHLKRGLPVRRGQRVRKGQVIGALGYTGQSTGPHLHFHIANLAAPLAAEGLAYRFASASWIGDYPSIAVFGAGERWRPRSPASAAFPPANAVIRFPD